LVLELKFRILDLDFIITIEIQFILDLPLLIEIELILDCIEIVIGFGCAIGNQVS